MSPSLWFLKAGVGGPERRGHLPALARSAVLATSGGTVSLAEDVANSIDALYRKDEAMSELKSEVMEALQREVWFLDDDSCMFAALWFCINLISRLDDAAAVFR
ncbi:unnamed protein product [Urochloa humidicola]